MSESTNGKLDWRPLIFSALLVIGGGAVQWGITSATLAEHTRRLEIIEKRMDERSMTRDEYERRHSDLAEKVRENDKRIRELEQKAHK